MGAAGRRNRAPLSTLLWEQPYRFNFFQAVRLLERIARQQRWPANQSVGHEAFPSQEAVRFRALPSLSFPPAPVCEIRRPKPVDASAASQSIAPTDQPPPAEMVVAFMGLTGPLGVLPHHYTALLISRARRRDFALRDFLAMFDHRTVSLFYRAWEKYRFPIGYERVQLGRLQPRLPPPSPSSAETPEQIATQPQADEVLTARDHEVPEDQFTQCLFSLVGLGTGGLRGRNQFDDDVFLYYAGLFAHYPRCAVSLEIMLADYFAITTEVRQFQGQWLHLEKDDLSALRSPDSRGNQNNQLGSNLVLGERVWNIESKFRIRLGPLNYRQFCRFLPSADRLRTISHLVRCYVGPQFDFDVQLILRAKEVPGCRLGGDGTAPSRLGWNTWLRSTEFTHDAEDAVFS